MKSGRHESRLEAYESGRNPIESLMGRSNDGIRQVKMSFSRKKHGEQERTNPPKRLARSSIRHGADELNRCLAPSLNKAALFFPC